MESKNQVQISLKLMTGETEVITINDNKEEIAKIVSALQTEGWLTHKDEGKLRIINGAYVVKITIRAIEGREVIKKWQK